MKILNLKPRPPIFKRLGMKTPMNDREFIEAEIKRWLSSPEREMQIKSDLYYNGEHDILARKRTMVGENGELQEVENLPNNRIVDNQYAKAVDQKANYLCGKPVTLCGENKEYIKALTELFGAKFNRTMKLLTENALIGGKTWLAPYYGVDGKLLFELIPAKEVLPFWADRGHTELDCAVHFFPVWDYDAGDGKGKIINKVEIIHGGGVERFIWEDGLSEDENSPSGTHIKITRDGKSTDYNWQRIPLICFKANHREFPLFSRVKCLQDALNLMISDFANNMEEDVRNTILVIENYDGEDLGSFRKNLSTYGAIKVNTVDGKNGGVKTLRIEVNSENYKIVIELLKRAIIENARCFDAKDERTRGTPNQMNIKSMYSDMDLDANAMQTEFEAAFEELLWFAKAHLANTGKGDFSSDTVKIVFNRDIMVNESEKIDMANKAGAVISHKTSLAHHPWVDNVEDELSRIKEEEDELRKKQEKNIYGSAFLRGEDD